MKSTFMHLSSPYAAEVNFAHGPIMGGLAKVGVELAPRSELSSDPPVYAKDVKIYSEHLRLKMDAKFVFKKGVMGYFDVIANRVRLIFDRRAEEEGFCFIEIEGIDFYECNDIVMEDGYETLYLRGVVVGFADPKQILHVSPEQMNWFRYFGVELKNAK